MAQVIIRNKLSQLVTATVIENGKVVALKIQPNDKSAPIDDSALTAHTRRLAERGYVKISPAT